MRTSEGSRVVVGVDGSATSLTALEWAARYAEQSRKELVVVVAWHVPTPYAEVDYAADLETAADAVVNDAVDRARATHPGLEITRAVRSGAPGQVLVSETKEDDVLVIGTRRTLGSVSSYCAHYAACPTVIVRDDGAGG